jgi:hypothetical protein
MVTFETATAQNVYAVFADNDTPDERGCSAREKVGECAVRECEKGGYPVIEDQYLHAVAPGVVEIKANGAGAAMSDHGTGYWWTLDASVSLSWKAGDAVGAKVSGAAGGVPAFELTTKAPSPLTMTEPVMGRASADAWLTAHQSRSADLTVKWTGGGAGKARLTLAGVASDGKIVWVRCDVAASNGALTVRKELLARMAGAGASLELESRSFAGERKGDWIVGVVADAPALTSSGDRVDGSLELE